MQQANHKKSEIDTEFKISGNFTNSWILVSLFNVTSTFVSYLHPKPSL